MIKGKADVCGVCGRKSVIPNLGVDKKSGKNPNAAFYRVCSGHEQGLCHAVGVNVAQAGDKWIWFDNVSQAEPVLFGRSGPANPSAWMTIGQFDEYRALFNDEPQKPRRQQNRKDKKDNRKKAVYDGVPMSQAELVI